MALSIMPRPGKVPGPPFSVLSVSSSILISVIVTEMLFAILNRNAELSADYFCLPAAQVVEIG